MRIFVQPTLPPAPKTKDAKHIAIFYAGILVIMAVAQLFTFEDLLLLFTMFALPGSVQSTYFLAALLVVAEVFALPFLLRMRISRAFRWVSMFCGWLVALLWTALTVWLVTQGAGVSNVGFVGTVIEVVPGWWTVFMSATFGIFAAWASWGMWPTVRSAKKIS